MEATKQRAIELTRHELRVDITDWAEQAEGLLEEGILRPLESEDDLAVIALDGLSSGTIATSVVALRANGLAPQDILDSDKELLYAGARQRVDTKLAARMRETVMANGQKLSVRELVGPLRNEDDDDDGAFVAWDSEEGGRRVAAYLLNTVPGYIRGRLQLLSAQGEDVRGYAGQLKAIIDEMVEELTAKAEGAV